MQLYNTNHITSDESRIIARAQAGDALALEWIIDRYAEQVYRVALRMLAQEADARDVQQETFIQVMKQIRRFRGDAAFATWIYAITARVCLSWRRKHRARVTVEMDEEHGAADNNVAAFLERHTVEQALQQLSPDDRLVIVLKYVEGLDHQAIARILGCSEETSRFRLSRARKRFRTWYQED